LKKIALTITLSFIILIGYAQHKTWEVVRKDLLTAVVQISNQDGLGTGFVMCDSAFKKFYLITNKHVVGKWGGMGDSVDVYNKISVIFYGANGAPSYQDILLKDANGNISNILKMHPNRNIDVAIVKLANTITHGDTIKYSQRAIPLDFLKSYKDLTTDEMALSIGSTVFAIGYPLGARDVTTNEPIVKHAYISSDISKEFSFPANHGVFKGKIIFLDGLINHGNSGGPVVTPQIIYLPLHPTQNYIIGLVSQGWDGTGMSLIYSSDYIKEVIKMF